MSTLTVSLGGASYSPGPSRYTTYLPGSVKVTWVCPGTVTRWSSRTSPNSDSRLRTPSTTQVTAPASRTPATAYHSRDGRMGRLFMRIASPSRRAGRHRLASVRTVRHLHRSTRAGSAPPACPRSASRSGISQPAGTQAAEGGGGRAQAARSVVAVPGVGQRKDALVGEVDGD